MSILRVRMGARRRASARRVERIVVIALAGALAAITAETQRVERTGAVGPMLSLPGWPAEPDQARRPAPPAPSEPITLLFVGDVLLTGDRDYLSAVSGLLEEADYAVGNLESRISERGERIALKLDERGRALHNEFFFRAPPIQAERLAQAGFDAMTLANNHIMDYGAEALLDTLRLLDEAGVAHAGAGEDLEAARQPIVAQVGGLTLAILAYVDAATLPGTCGFAASATEAGTVFVQGDDAGRPCAATTDLLRGEIGALRDRVDFIIVSFHWGTETKSDPDPLQRNLARTAIDAGADLIIGHHPHVLQGVEIYRGRPIVYSLGNFAFPTPWVSNQFSAALQVRFEDGRWTKLGWHPVRLGHLTGVPRVADGADADRIITRLKSLSADLGTDYRFAREGSPPLWLESAAVACGDAPEFEYSVQPHPTLEEMATVSFFAWEIEAGERVVRRHCVVVAAQLAEEVAAIFRDIYEDPERFPIHEVIGYNYRTVAGSQDRLSFHALGRAIDINRSQNPMLIGGESIVHPEETPYEPGEWRPGEDPYSIARDGSAVRAFTSRGWRWGGHWTGMKDYQHFDRPP